MCSGPFISDRYRITPQQSRCWLQVQTASTFAFTNLTINKLDSDAPSLVGSVETFHVKFHDKSLLHRFDGEFADVYEVAGDGGGCGHDRADQVRAAVFALAAFEIAVGGAGGALVRRKHVGVHADAHAAACVAPFETCFGENFVAGLLFRLGL